MIFSKNNVSSDKWEKKYFSLLDEQGALEKSRTDTEELLCKTITRLSKAATGIHKELDPYLADIRKQIKNGLKTDKLKQALEEFSSALMTLEEPSDEDSNSPAKLFYFLSQNYPTRQSEFTSLLNSYTIDDDFRIQDLLLSLHQLIEEESIVSEINTAHINNPIIREQLLNLLESTEIPEQFVEQSELLKTQLQTDCPLPSIFDDTISLMVLIRKHFMSEQQEMAKFLSQLTEQLNELGKQTAGAGESTQKIGKKRNLLDQSVSDQMLDLKQTTANATQLEPLKNLVNTKLENITQQIQTHQQQELQEREKTEKTLMDLTTKIKAMESESGELKSKLEIAYNQSIRDPLTGLPNRLAYDERLKLEIARFQRYQSPLSMVVWDIDFFKKINDTYGHNAGDKTLLIIANLLQKNCRETDFISRFGGEEFIMLLPDTDTQSAYIIAEKLRKTIEQTGFNSSGDKIKITISAGISQFTKQDSGDDVFKRADKALYKAKNNGRNRCEII